MVRVAGDQSTKSDIYIPLKYRLYANQKNWHRLKLTSAQHKIIEQLNDRQFLAGEQAIHLGTRFMDGLEQAYFPIWLDVEHPEEHHKSIPANIEIAQELYLSLDTQGLTPGLTILLSGSGFRFCWPFLVSPEYVRAFRLFLKDSLEWPGIDPSPQSRPNQWLMMAGYKTSNQVKYSVDKHIQPLQYAGQILGLSKASYLEQVNGKPDPAQVDPVLQRILPTEVGLTEEWERLLQDYQRIALLRSHIVKVEWPRECKKGVNWGEIESYLEDRGISWQAKQAGEIAYYPLSECPECAKREGNPYLTGAGRLKCFRTSCRAGEVNQDLRSQDWRPGLHPSQWVEGYTGAQQEQSTSDAYCQIADARQEIQEALQSPDDLLVRTEPGVGKTRAGVQAAVHEAKTKRVLLTVATHENAAEVYEQALEEAEPGVDVQLIQGRNKDNCSRIDWTKEVASRGFSPGMLCCPECPDNESCPYQAQFNIPRQCLVIAAHETAITFRKEPDLWLIDESPVKALLSTTEISPGYFEQIRAQIPQTSVGILDSIRKVAEGMLTVLNEGQGEQARIYAKQPPAEWEGNQDIWAAAGMDSSHKELLSSHLGYFDKWQEETVTRWQRRLYNKQKVDLLPLQWLWTATGDKPGTAYIQIERKPAQPIKYRLHRVKAPDWQKARIVCLDGTGDARELEALFPGREFRTVSAAVQIPGRKIHLEYTGLGKWAVCGGGDRCKPMEDQHIRHKLKAGLKCLRSKERRVLLVTFLDAKARVLQLAQELEPGREFEAIHYWGHRGLNKYQDCDAVLCFGTPSVNPLSVKDVAATLFPDLEQQQEYILALGRRDLAQAVHRIRPIYADKSIIVMGGDWPGQELGPPSLRIDSKQKSSIREAVARLKPIAQQLGLMSRELACLAGILCGQDAEQAEAWQEVRDLVRAGIEHNASHKPVSPPESILYTGALTCSCRVFKRKYWNQIISALSLELPDLPELKIHFGQGFSRGLGYISAARKFYQALDRPFDHASWEGQEQPEGRGQIDPVLQENKAIKRRTLPLPNVAGAMEAKSVFDFPEPVHLEQEFVLEAVGGETQD